MTLVDDLRAAFLTAELSDAQRAELIEAGDVVEFAPGDELFSEGDPADSLWILLDGEVDLSRQFAGRVVPLATMTTPGQWAGGLAAWAGDDAQYRASGRATTAGRCLAVPAEALGELVTRWSPFARHMIAGVYQTIRQIDATVRERESLLALGTLAAGLAHEINNPASASLRAVEALSDSCDYMLASLVKLAERGVPPEQFLALDRLRNELQKRPEPRESAMERADREEVIGTWLEDHDVGIAWRMAPVLAASGADRDWLMELEEAVGSEGLSPAVRWVTSTIGTTTILSELADATARISHLVEDVRTYSSLDRAELRSIDVTGGIDSTLTMLSSKLDGIEVVRDYEPDLPEIEVYAAELNQVWTNLIDNAAHAMEGAGTLRIAVRCDGDHVVVELTDSGPGIGPEVVHRVFEPFFTTKDVGQGTGLGLDISRRIVDRHGGEIDLESRPGSTTARVRIPAAR